MRCETDAPSAAASAASDSRAGDLHAARERIAELEAEIRRLRADHTTAAVAPYSHMRLLDVEACLVRQAIERANGNISRAARTLHGYTQGYAETLSSVTGTTSHRRPCGSSFRRSN